MKFLYVISYEGLNRVDVKANSGPAIRMKLKGLPMYQVEYVSIRLIQISLLELLYYHALLHINVLLGEIEVD